MELWLGKVPILFKIESFPQVWWYFSVQRLNNLKLGHNKHKFSNFFGKILDAIRMNINIQPRRKMDMDRLIWTISHFTGSKIIKFKKQNIGFQMKRINKKI